MKRLRWVSWCAVSSLPQAKKISLSEQSALNRAHIEKFDGILIDELIVPGESRSIVLFEDACARIEAYAKLRELIAAKTFDVLIYYDRSRIGRTASLSMTVVELCREAGILCYETESPPASLDPRARVSYDDLLIGAIKSVGAQQEIRKLTERQRIGMIHRVRQGLSPSRPPFGYKRVYDPAGNLTVEIDPAPAIAIKRIFDLYLQGLGITAIANMLNAEGAVAPAGQWTKNGVRVIVRRAWFYAGFVEYNVASKTQQPYLRAPATWQALISEDDALRAHAEFAERGQNRKLANTPYLLSGVVWCQTCKRRMTLGNDKGRHRVQIYCQRRCAGGWIDAKNVMAALDATIEHLATIDLDAADSEAANADVDAEYAEQVARLDAERRRLDAALTRADNAYTDGLMDIDRYRQQTKRIAAERKAVEAEALRLAAEIDAAKSASTHGQRVREVRDAARAMIDHPNRTLGNAWLRQFVRVWVSGNQVIRVEIL